jgi:RHS repeat-associated protein
MNDRRILRTKEDRAASTVARGLCGLVLLGLVAGHAFAQTVTTTTYSYNADGALTRVVEQVNGQPATTTYLTWDNCLPDTADPTSCAQITPGNGNLVAVGPVPGVENSERTFAFDPEDRLSGYTDADGSVTYRFHPTWMMASSTLGNGESQDSRYFYYDDARTAQMTNIEDSGSGLMSAEMGALRSISDGGLQVLLSPRKDVAGVYDPALGTFSPYRYDPFGDDGNQGSGAGAYDLNDNPRRYAGEYKDPTWGGYYLRARWYDPARHSFISRDPVANLNRYGYADGNPVGRVDPDGKSYHSFMRPLGKFLDKDLKINKNNTAGAFSRIFLSPVIAPLGLIASPGAFFHQQVYSKGGFKGWVTLGSIALELGTDLALPEAGYSTYALRLLADAAIGAGTSAANSVSRGGTRFSSKAFAQGMEYTAGGMSYGRVVAARGYRPFNVGPEDIAENLPEEEDRVYVYKVKRPLQNGPLGSLGRKFGTAGPIGDMLNLSWHHESIIAVTSDGRAYVSEVTESGILHTRIGKGGLGEYLTGQRGRLLGEMKKAGALSEFRVKNPLGLERADVTEQISERHPVSGQELTRTQDLNKFSKSRQYQGTNTYSAWSRNCQMHVAKMQDELTFAD